MATRSKFEPRSYRKNSATSLFASAILVGYAAFLPAILSRTLDTNNYKILLSILSVLPFVNILPFAIRQSAATRLASNLLRNDEKTVFASFLRFASIGATMSFCFGLLAIVPLSFICCVSATEVVFSSAGLALAGCGVLLTVLVSAPAASDGNFLVENLGKIWPPICTIAILLFVVTGSFKIDWSMTLLLICLTNISTPPILALLFRKKIFPRYRNLKFVGGELTKDFFVGSGGVALWSLTSYFSSGITVTIVASQLPEDLIAFSLSMTLVAVLSAAISAVVTPTAQKMQALSRSDSSSLAKFFRKFASFAQLYILAMLLLLIFMPTSVIGIWVNPIYASEISAIIRFLAPILALRLLTLPFTTLVMALARQEKLYIGPILEAIVASGLSIIFVPTFGLSAILAALLISSTLRLIIMLVFEFKLIEDLPGSSRIDLIFPYWALLKNRSS